MTMLNDGAIRYYLSNDLLSIEPLDPRRIQPASVDLTLGNQFRRFNPHYHPGPVDVRQDTSWLTTGLIVADGRYPNGESFDLQAGELALATTVERVRLPAGLSGRVEGKSSLGRLGLMAHVTAGFIDPGFEGEITLELHNLSPQPIRLYPGMPICQISFTRLSNEAELPYGKGCGSKYQGQTGPQPSRYWENFRQ